MKPQPRYQSGDRIGGRYQVHKALMGGMGEVYLCLDLEQNYPFALKTFQQRYLTESQALRSAFEREVATWVALEKHPNIVRCFYLDTLDRQPFMVLDWVASEEGKETDLRSWLQRGPLDLKQALEITIDLCQGLLHGQVKRPGLVYRDLKPENILMAQGGLAKITDFGLADVMTVAEFTMVQEHDTHDVRQSLFRAGSIVGTPAYMAPEQWRNEPLDTCTDLYALGCILYEMLAGHPPFLVDIQPSTPQTYRQWLSALQASHEYSEPVAPLPTHVPVVVDELIKHCLAKHPAARPAGVEHVLAHLTNLYQTLFQGAPLTRSQAGEFTAADYNNRGVTYAALGEREQALADFTQAIALDPADAQAYSNRGVSYAALGEREQALADFTEAIALDPALAQAYYNRGNTYTALGEREQALADFTEAIALDPAFAQAYYNRGNTYAALGQWEQALADYTEAIALDPAYAQAYSNRGITYAGLGQGEQALADYTQAIALDPANAQAYVNIGVLLGNQNMVEEALDYFEQAARLGNTIGAQYAALARQILGREPEAIG